MRMFDQCLIDVDPRVFAIWVIMKENLFMFIKISQKLLAKGLIDKK